jgi:hypothetical protein
MPDCHHLQQRQVQLSPSHTLGLSHTLSLPGKHTFYPDAHLEHINRQQFD